MNHIYCGDGKGKTTAALGLAIRAAGAGIKVHIIQFLKGTDTAELTSLEKIDNITIERCDENCPFSFMMNESQKAEISCRHNEMLRNAAALLSKKKIQMLVLDEFLDAYNLGLLDRELADSVALRHYETAEIVITGRNPSDAYISEADYISEISALKHPYNRGIPARKGIEF
ncbi:MAG: cob(I)yrinic acid a,c-diamide adenosyltransferase [Ruminococcus sp.]|nr:cob(I)yrinic acid a,c-diamide adenosyltransferase [Ruminococcus sp.]MBQ8298039.1 cob(I)yrinic acid a,c-diamide adenosyltransferase [Ruminococcus sp.]